MDFKRYEPYENLILRIFLGLTLIFWGYEKLTVSKLTEMYPKDYGPFMFVDVGTFLTFFGIVQPLLGISMILGFYTRASAALLALMGIITIIIPGIVIDQNVPHFAYAFATAGGALALFIRGGGAYSLDAKMVRSMSTKPTRENNP